MVGHFIHRVGPLGILAISAALGCTAADDIAPPRTAATAPSQSDAASAPATQAHNVPAVTADEATPQSSPASAADKPSDEADAAADSGTTPDTARAREVEAQRADRLEELALSMEIRQDWDRAIELRRKVCAIRTELFGDAYYETIEACDRLAVLEQACALDDAERARFAPLQELEKTWLDKFRGEATVAATRVAVQASHEARSLFGETSLDHSQWLLRLAASRREREDEVQLAEDEAQRVVAIADGLSATLCAGRARYVLGLLVAERRPEAAHRLFEESLLQLRATHDSAACHCLLQLARLHGKQARRDSAEHAFRGALALVEECAAIRSTPTTAGDRFGVLLEFAEFYQGEDDTACDHYYAQCIAAAKSMPHNSLDRANGLGFAQPLWIDRLCRQGRYGEARHYESELRDLADSPLVDPATQSMIALARIDVHLRIEDFARARQVIETASDPLDARQTYLRLDNPAVWSADFHLDQCDVLLHFGRTDEALQAIQTHWDDDDKLLINPGATAAQLHIRRAACFRELGDLDRALADLERADVLVADVEWEETHCEVMQAWGEYHLASGDRRKAIEAFRASLADCDTDDYRRHPIAANARISLALALADEGEFAEARSLLDEALVLYTEAGCTGFPIFERALAAQTSVLRLADRSARPTRRATDQR